MFLSLNFRDRKCFVWAADQPAVWLSLVQEFTSGPISYGQGTGGEGTCGTKHGSLCLSLEQRLQVGQYYLECLRIDNFNIVKQETVEKWTPWWFQWILGLTREGKNREKRAHSCEGD